MPTLSPLTLPRPLGLFVPLILALSLGGCGMPTWLGGEKDPTPPAKIEDFVAEVGLDVLWSARVSKGSEGRRLDLKPALSVGRVFVADARGLVVAADATSGRVLWERDTALSFSGGPDLEGDRLLLGTSGGQVVSLSANDGREQWVSQLASEVLSVPRHSGEGKVIVHTLDDTIYGLDAATGGELWRVAYPPPVLTLRGSSTPTITASGVLVGLSGGKLVKLDPADGTPLWEVTISPPSGRSELARISDIDADPVVVGTLVFVGTYNGDLTAVDLDTGTVLWRRELSSYAGLSATEDDLFVTDSDDQIWAADPATGAGRWKQERLRHRRLTAPAIVGNLIAVGDLAGFVHLIAAADGRLVGRARVTKKGAIMGRPLVSQNRLFVYASDGTLAALSVGSAPAASRRALRTQSAGGDATGATPADEVLTPPTPGATGSPVAP